MVLPGIIPYPILIPTREKKCFLILRKCRPMIGLFPLDWDLTGSWMRKVLPKYGGVQGCSLGDYHLYGLEIRSAGQMTDFFSWLTPILNFHRYGEPIWGWTKGLKMGLLELWMFPTPKILMRHMCKIGECGIRQQP